jgi:hypothetical protein
MQTLEQVFKIIKKIPDIFLSLEKTALQTEINIGEA